MGRSVKLPLQMACVVLGVGGACHAGGAIDTTFAQHQLAVELLERMASNRQVREDVHLVLRQRTVHHAASGWDSDAEHRSYLEQLRERGLSEDV